MFKKRYSRPGSAPATLVPHPDSASTVVLRVMEYNTDGCTERTVGSIADLPMPSATDNKVLWIEMNGLGDAEALRALGAKYKLHPLALEDVLNVGQRPKFEPYANHLFIIGQMIYRDAEECICAEQVSIFVCDNILITVQEDSGMDVFDPVRQRIRTGGGNVRRMKADYLAYALLDAIVDHGFPVLEEIGEMLEELEDEVLSNPGPEVVGQVHGLKRTLLQLRRFIWPERDVVSAMLHSDSDLIQAETHVFLRDLYDHTVQIMDIVESYRDVTTSIMEMYLSKVSLRTNETMRVLTVISSIFIPLTFIVGIYGMNFENMPELKTRWGYFTCLGVMALISALQLIVFRRRKWL